MKCETTSIFQIRQKLILITIITIQVFTHIINIIFSYLCWAYLSKMCDPYWSCRMLTTLNHCNEQLSHHHPQIYSCIKVYMYIYVNVKSESEWIFLFRDIWLYLNCWVWEYFPAPVTKHEPSRNPLPQQREHKVCDLTLGSCFPHLGDQGIEIVRGWSPLILPQGSEPNWDTLWMETRITSQVHRLDIATAPTLQTV